MRSQYGGDCCIDLRDMVLFQAESHICLTIILSIKVAPVFTVADRSSAAGEGKANGNMFNSATGHSAMVLSIIFCQASVPVNSECIKSCIK